jgi:hypothetical protein
MADTDRDRQQAEDRLNDIFEPDILLPIQYFAALKRKRFSCGEHRLLVAIIQDAVECFQKHIHARDSKRRQLFLDAEAWISVDDDLGMFSFDNICELLGLNSDYLRKGLLDWRDKERSRREGRLVHAATGAMRREPVRIESPVGMRPLTLDAVEDPELTIAD